MKRCVLFIVVFLGCVSLEAQSIDPVSLIIAKLIKAVDLQVQKLQNQTIWLQQAQQMAEHELSKLKLQEIADWQDRQRELYSGYFTELTTVKTALKNLPQVRQILDMQGQVAVEYNRFSQVGTRQSSVDELFRLSRDIVRSLEQVLAGGVSMKDADRALYIHALRDAMSECLDQLKALNARQMQMTASKMQQQRDIQFLKKLNPKL